MEKTITEITNDYIKQHPYIKACLKKGLINYSALARLISGDIDVADSASKEAMLIAARRFKDRLRSETKDEKEVMDLLENSETEIKNRMMLLIVSKKAGIDKVDKIQSKAREDNSVFYSLEGKDSYTIITHQKYGNKVVELFDKHIIKQQKGLALINLISSDDIENTKGVISYLSALFAENGVNIIEFLSCWTQTLFLIDSSDLDKVIKFLRL